VFFTNIRHQCGPPGEPDPPKHYAHDDAYTWQSARGNRERGSAVRECADRFSAGM